ncbi:MAG: hypothetical protein KDD61_16070 [Bdellovibrionales bacterium]|nr:hypothetical protein [Bdellovibrionales bacterium]
MKWRLETSQFDINAGQRAYIYQQLSEFDPFLLAESTVSVEVNPYLGEDPSESQVTVTITLTNDGTNVSASADATDVITATRESKAKLLEFLYQVQQEVLNLESTGS